MNVRWVFCHGLEIVTAAQLLGVAQKSHAPKDPVIRVLIGLQVHRGDVGEVGPAWFLVDGTGVHPGLLTSRTVDGVDMDDRHRLKQNLGFGLDQTAATPLPTGAL